MNKHSMRVLSEVLTRAFRQSTRVLVK